MLSRIRCFGLAAALSAFLAAPALAGPPWISIELPVNPYDESTRGAFLLVHEFHHGTPVSYIVTGTAEGIVNGERRSIKLEFSETAREACSRSSGCGPRKESGRSSSRRIRAPTTRPPRWSSSDRTARWRRFACP